ncbi:hypothetical protein [Aminobacterium colombiense]|uniref:hypothetical protein n=1 Tax=Aminobacterium colombiense TaxID=81468 RepID=UPI0025926BC4|nr:hypothetical protein [uncultured Aminobacterium sp.]
MPMVYCTNTESCPKCGKMPERIETTWRFVEIKCDCGNGYGAVGLAGLENGEEIIKRAFQQWNDGARKEKGLKPIKCRFRVNNNSPA